MASSSAADDARPYHTTQSVYVLPNDEQEHRRLEATAVRTRGLLDEKVVHAPLETTSIHRVIDIGCGTGATTHEFGTMFTQAQVYGVDLSAIPVLRPKLDNIEYIQGDIMELAAIDTDDRLARGTLDYVFSRFLMGGITEWKRYIELCVALAKPGAWVEMQEPDMTPVSLPPSGNAYDVYPKTPTLEQLQDGTVFAGKDPEQWRAIWHNLMRSQGLEPSIGALLAKYFEEAGLEQVQIARYVLPFGMWEGMTDAQRHMAPIHEAFVKNDAPVLLRKLGIAASMNSEDIDKILGGLRAFVEKFDGNREHGWVYVVYGRKPSTIQHVQ